MNRKIPDTPTSRASKETSLWTGSRPEPCPALGESVLMVFDGLLQVRIAERQQRPLAQLARVPRQPDPAQAQRRGNVQVMHVQSVRQEFRAADPVQIDVAHQNDQTGELRQKLCAALQVARKQQE